MPEIWSFGISAPVALAIVALIGYLFGRRTRQVQMLPTGNSRRELKRAKCIVTQMEGVANDVRRQLASHHSSITTFKERIAELNQSSDDAAWTELCEEAEKMLNPTNELAAQIAQAYDQIRQQTNSLMTFTEVHTDPLTGLSNRQAMDESLDQMFAMRTRYGSEFSVAIVDVDHFKKINDQHGQLRGDRVLQDLANLLDDAARETDIVTRYGGEEFVIVMPETELEGACIFCERLREAVENGLSLTISGGLATATDQDSPRTLIARADAALYSAKKSGRNVVYRHNGEAIELVDKQSFSVAVEADEGDLVSIEN